jgi:hypothetical protein
MTQAKFSESPATLALNFFFPVAKLGGRGIGRGSQETRIVNAWQRDPTDVNPSDKMKICSRKSDLATNHSNVGLDGMISAQG